MFAALGACRSRPPAAPVSEITLTDASRQSRILHGVFVGQEQWRWVAPAFGFLLDRPAGARPVYFELDFSVPAELMQPPRPLTLTVKVNGVEAGRATYRETSRTVFQCQVPDEALKQQPARVELLVDRSVKQPGLPGEVALIVVSAGLKDYEHTAEFRNQELAVAHEAYQNVLEQRNLRVPIGKQNELMRLFHDLPIWNSIWFHDVQILKNPLDLWMLQQIAYEVRPDFVIETGTFRGGSALYWAHTLNGMELARSRVLTVDLQDQTSRAVANPLWKKYVTFYRGSSTDRTIVNKIAATVKNSRVIVNLDSDHRRDHVLEELHLYAPLVSVGSYIAVEDTHLDGVPTHPELGPGPLAAVRQFLREEQGKNFEQDFTREATVMTSYPGGWLRRKAKD